MKVNLKYIVAKKMKGNTYHYFRRAGKYIRMPTFGTIEFYREYERLTKDAPTIEGFMPGTMGWLITSYRQTPEFRTKLAETTRANRERYFNIILEDHGHDDASGLTRRNVFQLRDRFSSTPGKADNFIATLNVLMKHALDMDIIKTNPCTGIPRLSDGEYLPWPAHIWQRAIAEASPMMRRVLFTLYYSGQRVSDVVKMSPTRIAEGMVDVTQQKTKKRLRVPIHQEWRRELEGADFKATTILHNRTGRPFTTEALQSRWRALRKKIGADDYHLHGLRKNACAALAESGCTVPEIAAITGQSHDMVEYYIRHADQYRLAQSAIIRWEEHSDDKSGKLLGKSGKL